MRAVKAHPRTGSIRAERIENARAALTRALFRSWQEPFDPEEFLRLAGWR